MVNAFTDDTPHESTAASVGGLARIADQTVHDIMNRVNGGDLLTEETRPQRIGEVIDVYGNLITFVDELFGALVRAHPGAIVARDESLVEVPPLVVQAREAENTGRRLRAEASGDPGHGEVAH